MDGRPAKRLKRTGAGGSQQRMAREAEEAGTAKQKFSSSLAFILIMKFCWGSFSPQLVQELALAGWQDVQKGREAAAKMDELEVLSKLGSAGRLSNNCHRDIMNFLGPKSFLPQPFLVKVPMKGHSQPVQTAFLLPHQMFSHIFSNYPKHFQDQLCQSTGHLRKFWAECGEHPCMKDHPIKSKPDWQASTVPILLHGDGTPVTGRGKTWSKQMTVFSWSSILSRGTCKETQIYTYSVFDKLIKKGTGSYNGTIDVVFKVLRWSFQALYQGVHPLRDWQGNESLVYNKLSCYHVCLHAFCDCLLASICVCLCLLAHALALLNCSCFV